MQLRNREQEVWINLDMKKYSAPNTALYDSFSGRKQGQWLAAALRLYFAHHIVTGSNASPLLLSWAHTQ